MSNVTAPKPYAIMFDSLFLNSSVATILSDLSAGIFACALNSARLLADAELLATRRRFATATFLTTTASEEIAKIYILLDAARLDLSRHENVLRRLCRAFFDHVAKHAYYKIHRMPRIVSIDRLHELWAAETIRWWPGGDSESGEPDMPHATFFTRELPLYVAFNDYSCVWLDPEDNAYCSNFEPPDMCSFSLARSMHDKIITARDASLFSPQVLQIVNDVFGKHYVGPRTSDSDLDRLRCKVASEVQRIGNLPEEMVLNSPLTAWPLYHQVAECWNAS